MKISGLLTDEAILDEIGRRMARRRLDLQLTQAELAEQAGVAKRTVERVEAGASAQLSGLLRMFRVLDLLPALDSMLPADTLSPMDLLKRKGRLRQRASSGRRPDESGGSWSWDDST